MKASTHRSARTFKESDTSFIGNAVILTDIISHGIVLPESGICVLSHQITGAIVIMRIIVLHHMNWSRLRQDPNRLRHNLCRCDSCNFRNVVW